MPEGFAVSGTPLGIVYDWGKDGFDVGSPPFAGDYVGPNGARWCIEYKAVGDDTTHRDCNRGGSLFFGEIIGNVQGTARWRRRSERAGGEALTVPRAQTSPTKRRSAASSTASRSGAASPSAKTRAARTSSSR